MQQHLHAAWHLHSSDPCQLAVYFLRAGDCLDLHACSCLLSPHVARVEAFGQCDAKSHIPAFFRNTQWHSHHPGVWRFGTLQSYEPTEGRHKPEAFVFWIRLGPMARPALAGVRLLWAYDRRLWARRRVPWLTRPLCNVDPVLPAAFLGAELDGTECHAG